ncbi:MAG: two-component system, chemotaxis family, protein-glutamate methylesterase/glutaminase [Mycobacteriales bacterium]
MPRRDLVVVAASAGGVEALRTLAAGLPDGFPAAVAVVLHVSAQGSVLPAILGRAGPLPTAHAMHGEPIRPGRIYVAPPDLHLIVRDGHFALSRGPRENGHRPAGDVLFRTAARARGNRVTGVVLSGALDDGTAGLAAIRERAGATVVQEPSDAMYPAMPQSALAHVPVDHVAVAKEIPDLLVRLASEEVPVAAPVLSELLRKESAVAGFDDDRLHGEPPPGKPAGFACPDCNGVLYEIRDGELVRFRCRVGHAWSPDGLLAQQGLALEGALWMALRSLEEKAALTRHLADQSDARGNRLSAGRFRESADESAEAAMLVRRMLQSGAGLDGGGTDGG